MNKVRHRYPAIRAIANTQYHRAIFDLLGVVPAPSRRLLAALKARERECGVRFPASVRAFYADAHADTLLEETTGQRLIYWDALGEPEETAQGWLQVATENQDVLGWYVRLDAGDDPPVLHDNMTRADDMTMIDWQPQSPSWTAFLFDLMAECSLYADILGLYLYARDVWPDAPMLARLKKTLREGPRTDTADAQVRRLYTKTRLLTITRTTAGGGEAEWALTARTPEALESLARLVWPCGTLAQTLGEKYLSDQGKVLLAKLRREASSSGP